MTEADASTEPDPDELRAAVRERWERAADGWRKRNERFQAEAMPVSQWLVEAIEPQPGQRVLELAAGVGETGFLAAELIAPGGGTLISSDGAEAMLTHARARADQLGLTNVEFQPLELEWIDLAAASVDVVICRWGYMFALDKSAALRETRRVLRSGGHLALATWTDPTRNPFAAVPRRALLDAGLVDAFELATGPGMFDLADAAALRELLEDAGFSEVVVEELPLTIRYDDVEDFVAATSDLSPAFTDVVAPLNDRQRADLLERLAAATAPFAAPDGALAMPAVALVATAEA
jgi:ubiquinone/menaquinone biosynthesis C-methylase UbiE